VNVYDGTFTTNTTERLANITLDQGSWLIIAAGTLGGNNNNGTVMSYDCAIYDSAGSPVTAYPVQANSPAMSVPWAAPFTLIHPLSIATSPASFSLRCGFYGSNNATASFGEYPNMYAIKTGSLTVSAP
jgi:hypothetical protein